MSKRARAGTKAGWGRSSAKAQMMAKIFVSMLAVVSATGIVMTFGLIVIVLSDKW